MNKSSIYKHARVEGRWVLLVYFLAFLLFLTDATMSRAATQQSKRFTLVIDAGHGGNDAGAIGAVTKEKTINLNVALAFGSLVERNCPDVKVIYTRKRDVFIPLHERADIANRNKADLFISIHTNSLPKGHTARGMETYTLGMHRAADNLDVAKRENAVILIEKDYKQRYQGFDPRSSESYIMFEFMQDRNMAQSVELAKYVQKRTCAAAGRANKGVKQAGFLVLRETSMPSCLIELGFISTPDEEQFLRSDAGVGRLALGIYQAFVDYKQKRTGVSAPVNVAPVEENRSVSRNDNRSGSSVETATATADTATLVQTVAPAPEPPVTQPRQDSQPVAPLMSEVPSENKQPTVAEPRPQATQKVLEFAVQILASSTKLKSGASQFKGVKDAEYYQEGGLYKYIVGKSSNYTEVYQLRKTLLDRFPQAFIIAFMDGKRTDVQAAIREYRNNKKKK